jgi:ubiquitin carboxyl-terminal hydrolase 40
MLLGIQKLFVLL